jgi:hypothetical protein
MICTQILSDCGQCSSGPSAVVDQSNARMRSPISPPPPSTDSINCCDSISGSVDSVSTGEMLDDKTRD